MPRKTYLRTEEYKKKMSQIKTQDLNNRFWSKVNIADLFSCWEWTAHKNHLGYGQFRFGCNMVLSHRLSWELAYGKIPNNLQINHKCHNPSCVNPSHLYAGTHQDNMNDMINANRQKHPIGENNGKSILTEFQAIEIIKLLKTNMKQTEIAKKLSVSKYCVWDIRRGKNWKYLPR